uniref:hypothetical protein n=1 Tax=Streptomyces antimycoticus TaxID=68175 RepID=UPI002F90F8E6|nr:hypothetical protein OG546_50240 [Streptomyces antimycoticus]
MDTTSVVVLTVVSIVTDKASLLVGLWLRLRWHTRHEQIRRQHLASVTEAIGEDGQVEVLEDRSDGHRVRIKITRTSGGTTAA